MNEPPVTTETITYLQIQQGLERCMAAEQPQGHERGLSRDASLLGDILGEMIWRRIDEAPLHAITGSHFEALVRWGVVNEKEVLK